MGVCGYTVDMAYCTNEEVWPTKASADERINANPPNGTLRTHLRDKQKRLAGTLAAFRASSSETEETYVSSLLIFCLSADCSWMLHKEIGVILSSVASRMTSLMSSKQWILLDEMRGSCDRTHGR